MSPVWADTFNLGSLNPGDSGVHFFQPNPGSFTDYLQFNLPSPVSALASAVSINLTSFLNISGLQGNLYSGSLPPLSGSPIGPTVVDGNVLTTFPSLSGGNYTFVYTGTATGSNGGGYLASVAAVPEAQEWAMMLAGLGLVALVATRRREGGAGHAA